VKGVDLLWSANSNKIDASFPQRGKELSSQRSTV